MTKSFPLIIICFCLETEACKEMDSTQIIAHLAVSTSFFANYSLFIKQIYERVHLWTFASFTCCVYVCILFLHSVEIEHLYFENNDKKKHSAIRTNKQTKNAIACIRTKKQINL